MKYSKERDGKYSHNKPKKDITGQFFSNLEVIEWLGYKKIGSQGKRRSFYKCKCKCGNTCEVSQTCLTTKNVKSCGCLIRTENKNYKGKNYSLISYLLNNYKQSAKRRNIKFSLNRQDFENLIHQNCHYCGQEPSTIKISKNISTGDDILKYNGIDRKDNTEGYTKENSVTCCQFCNFLKKDHDYNYFLKHIEKIYKWKIQSN